MGHGEGRVPQDDLGPMGQSDGQSGVVKLVVWDDEPEGESRIRAAIPMARMSVESARRA